MREPLAGVTEVEGTETRRPKAYLLRDLVVALALLPVFSCVVRGDVTPWPWGVTQLTHNEYSDGEAQIHNGQIAWSSRLGQDMADQEICFWDGSSISRITTNSYIDYLPRTHNGHLTWVGWAGTGSDEVEIFHWYDGTTTRLTNNSLYDYRPRVYDGQVAWVGSDGNDQEIYLWDYATEKTTKITDDTVSDYWPEIWNGQVTWSTAYGRIYLWESGTTTMVNENYYDSGWTPRIHNGQITWWGGGAGNDEIFYWDGSQCSRITSNYWFNDRDPEIHNGQIVWHMYDGNDWEIFFWNGTWTGTQPNITQVTDNTWDDQYPQICDGQVVWHAKWARPGVKRDVHYWDGSTVYRVTDSTLGGMYPRIWNGQVVWYGSDGNDTEIFYATYGQGPADLTLNPYDITVLLGEEVSFTATATNIDSPTFRWDWEGDGVWDTDWASANEAGHPYSEIGIYYPAVQARDPASNTWTAEGRVEVTPELGTWVLLASGSALGAVLRRRRKK